LGIAVDRIGNVYVTGSFSPPDASFGVTNLVGAYYRNFFLAKYDAADTFQWVRQSPHTSLAGTSVIVDDAGDVYTTPLTLLHFVHKYDGAGNLLWTQGASSGSRLVDHKITMGPDGSKYVTGTFDRRLTLGSSTFTNHATQAFLAKLEGAGTGPRLNIVSSATNLVLSWPLAAMGYVVESSGTVPGKPSWESLAATDGTNGLHRTLTVPKPVASRFYRLRPIGKVTDHSLTN
jgi:hypothetical protein